MKLQDNAYIIGSTLKISVTNLKAFKQLLEQAEKEAAALNKTMHQLRCFDLSVEFEDVQKCTEGIEETIWTCDEGLKREVREWNR
ncbi:hypothetical protein [Hominenteromicrobium sp.]|uniref:hypothetical protein n=1 Tax=Hominenteromicrobium sp. TaxID=3073581 RepID=UPI003A916D98